MVKFVERDLASGFGHETSLGLGQTFTADCRDKVGGRKGNVRQIMVASNEMGGTETWPLRNQTSYLLKVRCESPKHEPTSHSEMGSEIG